MGFDVLLCWERLESQPAAAVLLETLVPWFCQPGAANPLHRRAGRGCPLSGGGGGAAAKNISHSVRNLPWCARGGRAPYSLNPAAGLKAPEASRLQLRVGYTQLYSMSLRLVVRC